MLKKAAKSIVSLRQSDLEVLRDNCIKGASQGRNKFELCIVPLAQKWDDLPDGFRKAVLEWKRSVNPNEGEWPKNWATFSHSFFLLPYFTHPQTGKRKMPGGLRPRFDHFQSRKVEIVADAKIERLGIVLRTESIIGEKGCDHNGMLQSETAYLQFEEFAGLILRKHSPEFTAKDNVGTWMKFFVSYLWHPDRRPMLTQGFATVRNLWLEALNAIECLIQPPATQRRKVGRPKAITGKSEDLLRLWNNRPTGQTKKEFAKEQNLSYTECDRRLRSLQRREQRRKRLN